MQQAVLRGAPRAFASPALHAKPLLRPSRLAVPAATQICRVQQRRYATPHAISGPTLAGIEKRWETMPPQEQAELWMQLRDRMVEDWHHLTLQEKKASYWIAFGPHGPRAQTPPGEGWRIFWWTSGCIGLGVAFFFIIRIFAKPPPRTMTKEWQEKTNEYLKEQNTEPIDGVSSEGYSGKGMVQSRSGKPE